MIKEVLTKQVDHPCTKDDSEYGSELGVDTVCISLTDHGEYTITEQTTSFTRLDDVSEYISIRTSKDKMTKVERYIDKDVKRLMFANDDILIQSGLVKSLLLVCRNKNVSLETPTSIFKDMCGGKEMYRVIGK